MPASPTLTRLSAMLLPAPGRSFNAGGGRHRYRLLVVGPAILERPAGTVGPWRVRVTTDGTFLPRTPASPAAVEARLRRLRQSGDTIRLGAAILEPRDLARVGGQFGAALHAPPSPVRRHEFYGWALLYQLPGQHGLGMIDPQDDLPDLPACFESPLELADRQEFLARRGIPTRAIAVVTQPQDFVAVDQSRPANRFCPVARWRRACRATTFGP